MRILFAPEARLEFEDARTYYERQQPRLGQRPQQDTRQALQRIRLWPFSCPIETGEIRRLLLSRFPYKLLYSVEKDHLYIIAFAHQHRAPEYWSTRIR
ncbi:type II toxin-antitoxin system RelE/ParE family toxin [Thauera sp. SDU_THAU2]|uniref:type II toxin-antitoxin system RelE/ParE family toxin n=1 Tax=Thauera sp. SDU_THAU2 TaxID=3136633 RepID=UPI00311F354D